MVILEKKDFMYAYLDSHQKIFDVLASYMAFYYKRRLVYLFWTN